MPSSAGPRQWASVGVSKSSPMCAVLKAGPVGVVGGALTLRVSGLDAVGDRPASGLSMAPGSGAAGAALATAASAGGIGHGCGACAGATEPRTGVALPRVDPEPAALARLASIRSAIMVQLPRLSLQAVAGSHFGTSLAGRRRPVRCGAERCLLPELGGAVS